MAMKKPKVINWIKSVGFLILILTLAFSTVDALPYFAAASSIQDTPDGPIPLEAQILIPEDNHRALEHQNTKLDYRLFNLAVAAAGSARTSAELAESTDLRVMADLVEVYIVTSE